VGLTDEDEARGRKASEVFAIPYFSDKEELLSQPLDVVIICSETARHKEMWFFPHRLKSISSVNAARYLPGRCPRDVKTCEEHGVFLSPTFPLRYSPLLGEQRS